MKNDRPPAPDRLSTPLLVVLSAPSGGGKTTLCQEILARHPEMVRIVTCTTRPPRPGEVEARDYFFLDYPTFAERLSSGGFLEHATVYNHFYGIPRAEVLHKLSLGKDVLLNVDVQGAATLCARAAEDPILARALATVFLTPATLDELEIRLRRRGTDSPAQLEKRLSLARQEIAQWRQFEYLIISTTVAEDVRRMEAIIDAERMRQTRSTFAVDELSQVELPDGGSDAQRA
ncbi:MAG TPA: guanylate kinase [Candidatus Saccharimonadales bacterium]|nr:guanylate kinase [Candidatus Saccharimonadales bacterium]